MERQLVALASQIAATKAHLQWLFWLPLVMSAAISLYICGLPSGYASRVGEFKGRTDKLDDLGMSAPVRTRPTARPRAHSVVSFR
jgi:hypothetical protein